jgi:GntR family transcriptional regulator, rspAB operon transcriptional repressor
MLHKLDPICIHPLHTMDGHAVNGRDESSLASANGAGVERLHEHLREAILDGTLAPGAALSQVALAQQFGVSRTPLREALRLLQREGLIEGEANKRVRVADFSLQDLEELYALRIVNDALGIRITVARMDADDDQFLAESLRLMDSCAGALDVAMWEHHHKRFHERLVRGAGSRHQRLLRQLSDHSERYRRLYISQGRRAWSVGAAEHAAIVDACLARDAQLAAERLARHLSSTVLNVLTAMAPEHEPALVRGALRSVIGRRS